MKIINLNGYSNDELFTWRATVYRNVVESAQTIVQAVRDSGLTFERSELNVNERYQTLKKNNKLTTPQDNIDRILSYRVSGNPKSQLSPEIIALTKLLWQDPVVKSCLAKGEYGFYLMDSAPQ